MNICIQFYVGNEMDYGWGMSPSFSCVLCKNVIPYALGGLGERHDVVFRQEHLCSVAVFVDAGELEALTNRVK